MIRLTVLLAVLAWEPAVFSQSPPMTDALRQAVGLELQGRLHEALDQYREISLSKDFGADTSKDAQALRVLALSKSAHLAFDLGMAEDAWDLGGQLIALGSPGALAAGQGIRQRLQDAKSLPPKSFWAGSASWLRLPGPAQVMPPPLGTYWRIQLGAFREWTHARTQLDILLEKGWSPYLEDRYVGKDRLLAVFLVSTDLTNDLKTLKTQGFQPVATAVNASASGAAR